MIYFYLKMLTTPETKTLIVVNPAAGRGKAQRLFRRYAPQLERAFPVMEVRESEYPGHLLELGQWAAEEKFGRIITVGGDGTPYEFINGLCAKKLPDPSLVFGILPGGSGNSFIRDFGDGSPQTALNTVLSGALRRVDLVEFTYYCKGEQLKRYFLNIVGLGLVADILKLTNEKLKFLGSLGYSIAVIMRLIKGMNNRICITADGMKQEFTDSALTISNSQYTGGKMKIAPFASVFDGVVDVTLFNKVNRREIIDIFLKVFKGAHVDHPKVESFTAQKIHIDSRPELMVMADGELLGKTPFELQVIPSALTLLV